MKKIINIFMILAIGLVSCERSLEDTYDELDAQLDAKKTVVGVIDYTLTAEDYELYETELNEEEFFENQDQADLIIPDFLADKYPVLGEASLVNVGYNLFDETVVEEISTTETLSNLSSIDGYLSSNYETAENGTFVELTYNADVLSKTLSGDDIRGIANNLTVKYPDPAGSAANFGNFDRREDRDAYWSDDMILEGLLNFLGEEYNVGQVVVVTFPIWDGGTNFSESFTIQHNGYRFLKLDIDVTASDAIAYTLTGDDYDTIAADLSATYPNPASNLGQFGSFDVRVGSSDNAWTEAMILEGLNIILPSATEGDVYAVTYAIYNGSAGTETMTLLYESGSFVPNATIVEATATVAKNNGDWEFPYEFSNADFDSFGFRFPNFSSSNIYILDIFLEDLKPFAQAGDVTMVQYNFFSGGASTKYGQSIFNGDKWTLTPDVIETFFQYGFEDGEWVPDNTIAYNLLTKDYAIIGADANLLADYPDAVGNLNRFGNFNRTGGSTNWADEMLIEGFNVLLDAINPTAEEGQKYAITYAVWIGSPATETFKVVKVDGKWIDNN